VQVQQVQISPDVGQAAEPVQNREMGALYAPRLRRRNARGLAQKEERTQEKFVQLFGLFIYTQSRRRDLVRDAPDRTN
jgi:hypothetical protein